MPKYPGLGLPLRHNDQYNYGFYPIGAHGSCAGSDSDMLPIRELAMMSIMDRLTDKVDWHKKAFDDEIVAKWREEALSVPDDTWSMLAYGDKRQHWCDDGTIELSHDGRFGSWRDESEDEMWDSKLQGIVTEDTFNCCIQELQSKARYYEKSGIVPTLDACAAVAKSNKLVTPELHEALRSAFAQLKADQTASPDWHPRSNDMVQDLVHPSMYPLVYGRSRVFKKEVVGVNDAIEKWAGKGKIIPGHESIEFPRGRYPYNVGGEIPPGFWSDTYQWLPANVAFQKGGGVKFTSYVNNLHPIKYKNIYRTIEKLIETAIPLWDQCLTLAAGYNQIDGPGRCVSRFDMGDPDDNTAENWVPSDPQEVAHIKVDWGGSKRRRHGYNPEYDDETEQKWKLLRKPAIPEPTFKDVDYMPELEQRLAFNFETSGLQIIVKIASIELTPEKPNFPTGGWHIEGQMNEGICATALYYLDSDNITDSNLSFRMQTSAYLSDDIDVGQDAYSWLERVYGTSLGSGGSPCLQNYGSVETPQGRLLAFPNVFQHRVSPFGLIDPTKPGHRRFIALWLVDPNKRIISTANVPPQQQDWWIDSIFGDTPESRSAVLSKLPSEVVSLIQGKDSPLEVSKTLGATLPAELMDMVRDHFITNGDALPMGLEEAKEHRKKLMEVRSAFVKDSEVEWQQHTYNFCEH